MLVATRCGRCSSGPPKPNAAACRTRAAWPTRVPRIANAVLHEVTSASSSDSRLLLPHDSPAKLRIGLPGPNDADGGESMTVSGVSPWLSAAAAVMTLKVDPGE